MNWLRFLLPALLLPVLSTAGEGYFTHFNTDAFWQMLVQDTPGTTPNIFPGDTAVVVASNRATAPYELRFMADTRDDDSVRYFIVYTSRQQWHVQQRPSLRAAIQALPQQNKDWVVYTEGMGRIFTSGLDRGMKLAGHYGVNVLLLDYPSIHTGYKSYRNYRFAYHNSCIAYKDFLPVLDRFKRLRQEGAAGSGALTLFFHSMGNNVLRELVQNDRLALYNDDAAWVDNLVLNAPCVPRRNSRQWIDRIHFAKRIYVHYNPNDIVLKLAQLAGFRQVLGLHVKGPVSASVQFINFNLLCGNGHNNFLSLYRRPPALPEAVAHYSRLFHGGVAYVQDTSRYRKSSYRGIGWDILPVGR